MKRPGSWIRKQTACVLAMLLAMPLAEAAAAPPQQGISGQQTQSAPAVQSQRQDSGSRAGTAEPETGRSDATLPDSPVPIRTQVADQSGQPATSQSSTEQQEGNAPKPVGAAAAPYEKTTGVAASRPSGAVIAPAKQRRARSIVIRVGIIAGAAVAIGTVVALSRTSPSRPN